MSVTTVSRRIVVKGPCARENESFEHRLKHRLLGGHDRMYNHRRSELYTYAFVKCLFLAVVMAVDYTMVPPEHR